MPRLFGLPSEPELPPAIVLFFEPDAIDPATKRRRLAVEMRDAASGDAIAALGVKDAHAWLTGHGYRWEPALQARWVRA